MKLDKVVPFGRSLDEYTRIFKLTEGELGKRILDVAAGPASFNAEMAARGRVVVSVDPLFVFSADEIEARFFAVADPIIAQVAATPDDWVWCYHRSPADLRKNRESVLRRFIADYPRGRAEGRYVIGELPVLDLDEQRFDIALSSHFLFLYSDHFTFEFHLESVLELLRVADEVRIFPLLSLIRERSPYLDPLVDALRARGFVASVAPTDYEFQKGGNEMLRIRRHAE